MPKKYYCIYLSISRNPSPQTFVSICIKSKIETNFKDKKLHTAVVTSLVRNISLHEFVYTFVAEKYDLKIVYFFHFSWNPFINAFKGLKAFC